MNTFTLPSRSPRAWARASARCCAASAARCRSASARSRAACASAAAFSDRSGSFACASASPKAVASFSCAIVGAASARSRVVVETICLMVMVLDPLTGLRGERARTRHVRSLSPPELVAEHADFEQQRCRVDAAPELAETGGRRARRRVRDFEQAAFELVEHDGDGLLARIDRVLAVKTAGGDEILGPALFDGD